jgi:drug/metabolite transporter (DMT)-like permease
MLTIAAIVLRILVNPLVNVFQKRICTKGQSPLFANFLTYCGLSVLVIPWAWNVSWTALPQSFWGYAVLVGFLAAWSNGLLGKAMQCGELSVLGPLNAWKSVVGLVFGIFLLGEIPSGIGWTGLLLILLGSYFIVNFNSASSGFSWNFFLRRDLQYRIAATVLAAVEAVFIKKMILCSNPQITFILWPWGGMLFSFLLLLVWEKTDWRREWIRVNPLKWHYFALIASVGLMQFTTNLVFDKIVVVYALALFQLSAVLSVFYGWLFFNETKIYRKLIASAVMVAGSVLIIWN